MGAFFAPAGREPQPLPEQGQPSPTVRTTITLTQEDADRLEVLRMQLRHREGRGLTYSDVVGLALRHLAASEPVPKTFSHP
jgi:hypothetical protein